MTHILVNFFIKQLLPLLVWEFLPLEHRKAAQKVCVFSRKMFKPLVRGSEYDGSSRNASHKSRCGIYVYISMSVQICHPQIWKRNTKMEATNCWADEILYLLRNSQSLTLTEIMQHTRPWNVLLALKSKWADLFFIIISYNLEMIALFYSDLQNIPSFGGTAL